jgi:beta-glucosidase
MIKDKENMMRKLAILLTFSSLLCLLNCQQSPQSPRVQTPVYQNPDYTAKERARDLVSRMTLEEKLAQFTGSMKPVKSDPGVGTFGFMTMHLPIREAVEEYNTLQHHQIENTRLGIPATRSGEGIFAYMGNGSTSFPQSIAVAATFDPDCVSRMATVLSVELKSRGIRRVLAPVVNLTRDPRWGRANETYGEDPYLSGLFGSAYIRVMEAAGLETMVKHFVANMGLDGQFTGPVHFSERLLRETYFPAFKACIEAGASSVMMAYNSLNGIPCATHKWLITDILKGEWGLQGYVSTDGGSSQLIYDDHGIYETPEELAVALMHAGCDKSSPDWFFQEPLKNALHAGLVSEERIDDAVYRILLQKIETGLFESPYADPDEAVQVNNHPDHRRESLDIARKSLVLLKNEHHTLPFSKEIEKIAVVGPLADWLLVGHYGGYGRHEVTVLEGVKSLLPHAQVTYAKGTDMRYFAYPAIDSTHLVGSITAEYYANPDLSGDPAFIRQENRIEHDWKSGSPKGLPKDHFSARWSGKFKSPVTRTVTFGTTIDDGARLWIDDNLVIDRWSGGARRLAEATVRLEKGRIYDFTMEYYDSEFNAYAQLGWDVDLEENIPQAVQAAGDADAIIAVMGMYENEGLDRADLDLAPEQETLIQKLAKLDKPLVVVLQSGTVITMRDWIDKVDAVMVSWYPGCEGGHAIAEAIFGDVNPGGKLPVTFPQVTGQVPLNYNRLPKGKKSITFLGVGNNPEFCFGHGLSYTQFKYSDLHLSAAEIAQTESLTLSFIVHNTGNRPGDEVAQLYIHDRYASVSQPLQKLSDFKRITLDPGESQEITFNLTPEKLKIWDIDMNHTVEPGDFEIMVGASSQDIRLKDTFRVLE